MRDNVKDTRCSLKRRLEDMALGASVVTISATNNRANASLLLIYRTDPFPVVLDLNGNNEVVMAYVSEAGIDRPIERIAFINGTPRNRQVFHADALGAVVALTDENGEPVQTYTYAAFGSIRTQTGTDLNPTAKRWATPSDSIITVTGCTILMSVDSHQKTH